MKAPLLNEWERRILREQPNGISATFDRLYLAERKFKREFEKSWLIQKVIKPLVDHLSKAIQAR